MTHPNSDDDDDPTPLKPEKNRKSTLKRSPLSKKRRRFQRRRDSEGEDERSCPTLFHVREFVLGLYVFASNFLVPFVFL